MATATLVVRVQQWRATAQNGRTDDSRSASLVFCLRSFAESGIKNMPSARRSLRPDLAAEDNTPKSSSATPLHGYRQCVLTVATGQNLRRVRNRSIKYPRLSLNFKHVPAFPKSLKGHLGALTAGVAPYPAKGAPTYQSMPIPMHAACGMFSFPINDFEKV